MLLDLIPKPDVTVDDFVEDPGFCDKVKLATKKSSKELFKMDQE